MFSFFRKPDAPREAPPTAPCPAHGVEAPLDREEVQGQARQAVYAHEYYDAGIRRTHEFKVRLVGQAAARGASRL